MQKTTKHKKQEPEVHCRNRPSCASSFSALSLLQCPSAFCFVVFKPEGHCTTIELMMECVVQYVTIHMYTYEIVRIINMRTYVYIHICAYACCSMSPYICIHIHMRTYVYILYICADACCSMWYTYTIHVYTYAYVCMCICIHMYASYICVHLYTYACAHMRTYVYMHAVNLCRWRNMHTTMACTQSAPQMEVM